MAFIKKAWCRFREYSKCKNLQTYTSYNDKSVSYVIIYYLISTDKNDGYKYDLSRIFHVWCLPIKSKASSQVWILFCTKRILDVELEDPPSYITKVDDCNICGYKFHFSVSFLPFPQIKEKKVTWISSWTTSLYADILFPLSPAGKAPTSCSSFFLLSK